MSQLAEKNCVPCEGGVPPLPQDTRRELLAQLQGWEISDGHHLRKIYSFSDFASALAWTNEIGEIAEEQGHHPDLELGWGYVNVSVWTHKIDGLTESDFVFAAKLDQHFQNR